MAGHIILSRVQVNDSWMLMLKHLLAQVLMVRSHQIYALDCAASPAPQKLADESIVLLTSKSIDDYPSLTTQLTSLNQENTEYLEEIRRDRMVGALVEYRGQLVHYGFFYKQNRTACLLGLPSSGALIGNSFTTQEYRGKGCQGRSVLARALVAREAGFSMVFAETSIDNVASGRGLAKAGMEHLGRIDFVVIGRALVIRWRRPASFPLLGFCR